MELQLTGNWKEDSNSVMEYVTNMSNQITGVAPQTVADVNNIYKKMSNTIETLLNRYSIDDLSTNESDAMPYSTIQFMHKLINNQITKDYDGGKRKSRKRKSRRSKRMRKTNKKN